MLDCTATGGRQGPNALPLTSCHLTVRNSILASGSGNSPVGSVSITATFPSWTRSLWRSRPSLPTGLNPIIRSDDYAQLLKTFSLDGGECGLSLLRPRPYVKAGGTSSRVYWA